MGGISITWRGIDMVDAMFEQHVQYAICNGLGDILEGSRTKQSHRARMASPAESSLFNHLVHPHQNRR